MVLLGLLQSGLNLVDFFRRGLGSAFRLLLKSLQHVNSAGKLDGIDGAVRAAGAPLAPLEPAAPGDAPRRFGSGVLPAGLRVKKRLPDCPADALREPPQILSARRNPEDWLRAA